MEKYISHGVFWNDLTLGERFKTNRRTITESDLVGFINATGMLEQIFTVSDHDGAIAGRPVPAALTYGFIEGMQTQSLLQCTGLALLEVDIRIDRPVRVGDTISATIEITGIRESSKGNRAVVSSRIEIFNQRQERVLHYTTKRLIAGRTADADRASG